MGVFSSWDAIDKLFTDLDGLPRPPVEQRVLDGLRAAPSDLFGQRVDRLMRLPPDEYAELDAPARPARRVPGRPVSGRASGAATGAHRLRAGRPGHAGPGAGVAGRGAVHAWTGTLRLRRCRTGAGQAAREPIEDLRVDFEDGYGVARRRARRTRRARRPPRRVRERRARRRSSAPVQVAGGGHPAPGDPHAGRVPRRPARRRPVRGHAAQGERRRAGRRDGVAVRAAGGGARPGPPGRCGSRSRSRRPLQCSARTARPRWPG